MRTQEIDDKIKVERDNLSKNRQAIEEKKRLQRALAGQINQLQIEAHRNIRTIDNLHSERATVRHVEGVRNVSAVGIEVLK